MPCRTCLRLSVVVLVVWQSSAAESQVSGSLSSGTSIRNSPIANPGPSLTPSRILNPRGSINTGQILNPAPSLARPQTGISAPTSQSPESRPVTVGPGHALIATSRPTPQEQESSTTAAQQPPRTVARSKRSAGQNLLTSVVALDEKIGEVAGDADWTQRHANSIF